MRGREVRLRGVAAGVCLSLVAMAVAVVVPALPVAQADAAPLPGAWSFAQVLTNDAAGTPTSEVSMSDQNSSVAIGNWGRCLARAPLTPGDTSVSGLAVADQDPSADADGAVSWHGADWFPMPDCDAADFDLSANGRTLVASMKSNIDLDDECPAPPGTGGDLAHYDLGQIVMWTRSGPGSDFGAPQLVSRVEGDCDNGVAWGEWGDREGSDPVSVQHLIGNGGSGTSSLPSVDGGGLRVSFTSKARDFGAAPTDAGSEGLFVADLDVASGGLPVIGLVTPVGFEGHVYASEISDDGESVVFTATGTGMVSGVDVSDGRQVFVAQAPSSGDVTDPWTIELASADESGAPLVVSAGSAQDRDVAISGCPDPGVGGVGA